ncbi:MAG: GSU2403 family nucleotidyltransferase fold protein [Allosphingosinicella sp.]
MLRPIPLALLTLYSDLAQRARLSGRGGAIYRRTLAGASYLYAKVPVAGTRRDVFLGREDEDEAQLKAETLRRESESARERRASVRMLRQRGMRGPDAWLGKVLDAVADAGLFEKGVTLVGTGAYQLMEPLVAHYLPDTALVTGDVDLVTADLALRAETGESMEAILKRADPDVIGIPELDPRSFPSGFKGKDIFVDLLTPVLRRSDTGPMPLAQLSAAATPPAYLRWLTEETVDALALWGAGIPVRIPAPARYAVHKLILAQRRNPTSRDKRFKDLAQAGALVEVLAKADPFALEDALADARGQGGRGWSQPIARSLKELGLDL